VKVCESFYPFAGSSEVPRAPISNCQIIRRIVQWPPSFLSRSLNNATCMKDGPPVARAALCSYELRKNYQRPMCHREKDVLESIPLRGSFDPLRNNSISYGAPQKRSFLTSAFFFFFRRRRTQRARLTQRIVQGHQRAPKRERQSTEYFSLQFRATFVTFSGRGVLLLRRDSTRKVLDAMRRRD